MRFFLAAYFVAQAWLLILAARQVRLSAAGQPDGRSKRLNCCPQGSFHGPRACASGLPSRTDAAVPFAAGRNARPVRAGSPGVVSRLPLNNRVAAANLSLLVFHPSARAIFFVRGIKVFPYVSLRNRRTHRLPFWLGFSRSFKRYG